MGGRARSRERGKRGRGDERSDWVVTYIRSFAQ